MNCPGSGIVRQCGDGEDVIAGQLIDQVRDAGDIVRAGTALASGHRIDDIRCGTARDDDRPVPRNGPVELWVAAAEGEGGRHHRPELVHDGPGKLHDLRLSIDLAAMPGEYPASLFVSHQQADVFKDFQRGRMCTLDLFRGEKCCKGHQRITSSSGSISCSREFA